MSSRFSHTHIIWTTQLGYYLDAQDSCLRTWVLLHLLPASQTVVLNRNLPLTCPNELRTQWPLESPGQLCGFQSKFVLKAYVNFGRVPHIKLFAVLFAWSYILRKKRINHHCLAGSVGRACYAVLSNHQTEGPCTLQRHPMASKSPKLTSCTWKISWVTGHTWSCSVSPTSFAGNKNFWSSQVTPFHQRTFQFQPISRLPGAAVPSSKCFTYKCKPDTVKHSTKNNIRYFDCGTMQYNMTWQNVHWKNSMQIWRGN